ncbi:MAG: hypothetical protein O6837_01920 [Deltaproteobacteria bacterium]|nr:hypothetical protein [Deltaproteobacteria bacterium]
MTKSDPFHEAQEAVQTAEREYTATGSINAATAYTVVHAAETAVRELYTVATGTDFPHDKFEPSHVPETLVTNLGLAVFYSPESQTFLGKLTGYAPQNVRYENTRAYQLHTDPKAAGRGKDLVDGITRFVEETENLAKNPAALKAIRSAKR